jgi:hypothetical protein
LDCNERNRGMHPYARSVLDNWLTYFIGKRGFVRYRGLEMAQTCRMLTNIAQYYLYTRDHELIIKHLTKIEGTNAKRTKLLVCGRSLTRVFC